MLESQPANPNYPIIAMTLQNKDADGDRFRLPHRQDLAPKKGAKSLNVGIIGAGIAGLTAAIAMSQSGHDVEVGERVAGHDEIPQVVRHRANENCF